jgi:biotin synthase-like enzyme
MMPVVDIIIPVYRDYEPVDDIIKMTDELRAVGAKSIPVNFFIPVKGHRIPEFNPLTPPSTVLRFCQLSDLPCPKLRYVHQQGGSII